MTGVNIDLDAHPGAQRRQRHAAARVDAHAQWDALDDFDPIAARVLCRQQLEFLGAGRTDAFDGAMPLNVGDVSTLTVTGWPGRT